MVGGEGEELTWSVVGDQWSGSPSGLTCISSPVDIVIWPCELPKTTEGTKATEVHFNYMEREEREGAKTANVIFGYCNSFGSKRKKIKKM